MSETVDSSQIAVQKIQDDTKQPPAQDWLQWPESRHRPDFVRLPAWWSETCEIGSSLGTSALVVRIHKDGNADQNYPPVTYKEDGLTALLLSKDAFSGTTIIYGLSTTLKEDTQARQTFAACRMPPQFLSNISLDSGFQSYVEENQPNQQAGQSHLPGISRLHYWWTQSFTFPIVVDQKIKARGNQDDSISEDKPGRVHAAIYACFDNTTKHTVVYIRGYKLSHTLIARAYAEQAGCFDPFLAFGVCLGMYNEISSMALGERPPDDLGWLLGETNKSGEKLKRLYDVRKSLLVVSINARLLSQAVVHMQEDRKRISDKMLFEKFYFVDFRLQATHRQSIAVAAALECELPLQIAQSDLLISMSALNEAKFMKIITVVTLVFLPPTFVATLYGMNMFSFDFENSGVMSISQDWWKVLLTVISLSFATFGGAFGYWRWQTAHDSRVFMEANLVHPLNEQRSQQGQSKAFFTRPFSQRQRTEGYCARASDLELQFKNEQGGIA